MKQKILLMMVMLVVVIVSVGMVSAEENVTADIDVPTEEIEIDDAVVETDEIDDSTSDVDDESGNLRTLTATVDPSMNSYEINQTIANNNYVIFTTGIYSSIYDLTLKDDTTVDGNGSTLYGNGANDIFLINNCNNITIKNFILDVNGASHGIYGSNVTNSVFNNNTISNAKDGININYYYDNLTIEDNKMYSMSRNGISLANPVTNGHAISDLGYTSVSRNLINIADYGMFIGGKFKGTISDNNFTACNLAMQFVGKPNGDMGNIIGNITNNNISSGNDGIEFINETITGLTMNNNNFSDMYTDFAIKMSNSVISNSTINANNFVDINSGINIINTTTNNLVISYNNMTNVRNAINIEGSTLNSLTLEQNNMNSIHSGFSFINTTIVRLIINSNHVNTTYFSYEYALWDNNITKPYGSYLQITSNYLHGCVHESFLIKADLDDENNTGMVIVG